MAEDFPFMDRVHASLFSNHLPKELGNPPFGEGTTNINKDAKQIQAKYRGLLRRAEKFVVTDSTVRFICHLLYDQQIPVKQVTHDYLLKYSNFIKGMSYLAHIPFDVCWFELNDHIKKDELEKMDALTERFTPGDPRASGPVMGILLYRDDPNSSRWVQSMFWENFGVPRLNFLSTVFDPQGTELNPVRGSTHWKMKTLSLMPDFPKLDGPVKGIRGELRSKHIEPEHLPLAFINTPEGIVANDWTADRVGLIPDPFWWAFVKNKARFNKFLASEAWAQKGDFLWTISLLASINAFPREVRPVATRVGTRHVGANLIPYFQHSTISIRLPRDNRVVWARKHLERTYRNMPRAWHRVRGHWRIIERGKTPPYICRHVPTMEDNRLAICEKCELRIRWIPDHSRGTPELGIVEHAYKVTT